MSRPQNGASSPAPDLLREKLSGRGGGWIRWSIIAAITLVIFFLLSTRMDFGEVRRTLAAADLPLLLLALALTATFPVFSALRWRRMLGALGYDVSFRDCFAMIMAAWPMGTITPSKAGDLVKAYYLKDRVPVGLVLGSVLAERALDVLVLLALALLGCLAFQRWSLAAISGAALLTGLIAIFILLRFRLPIPEKHREKVDRLLSSFRLLVGSPSLLLAVVVYTVLNWGASVVQLVICYHALGTLVEGGISIPLTYAMGALPLAIFVGLLPVTLGGMGTRDAAIILLFAEFAPSEVSLGVGILYSLLGYWLPALAGLPFMRRVLPR